MGRRHHIQDITTQYGFTLEFVERQNNKVDGLRDWYKWVSDDGRFTVCCDDACDGRGRHTIHLFLTGDFKYRPEVYVRTDDNTGAFASIVVRPGSDDGGLVSLERIDAYIDELVVTRKAVQAIRILFVEGWATIKSKVDLDFALVRQFGGNRMQTTDQDFWAQVMKERV